MFTGIIEAVGSVTDRQSRGGDVRLRISTGSLDLSDGNIGESIAVNGVCLTAIEIGERCFFADVSRESLSRTTLGSTATGNPVNLERALLPTSRLGGHLVSGHVDGIGEVVEQTSDARSTQFSIQIPGVLARYIAEKGSICLDGVSLTVNSIVENVFAINVVPHTLAATTLGSWTRGRQINVEVDLVARYLERLSIPTGQGNENSEQITLGLLSDHGFLNKP